MKRYLDDERIAPQATAHVNRLDKAIDLFNTRHN
jgi:hypothetical protein